MQASDSIDVAPGPLVDRVRHGDSAGVEELRQLLGCGIRYLVARELPASQVNGCTQDVLDRVTRGIQNGDLGNPARLVQYVRTHLATRMREIQHEQGPREDVPIPDSSVKIMQDLLLSLSQTERESLDRYYVRGQDDRQICRELHVPATEFRSLKMRVKARFYEVCQKGSVGGFPSQGQGGAEDARAGAEIGNYPSLPGITYSWTAGSSQNLPSAASRQHTGIVDPLAM